jgi:hypothetical protein
MDTYEHDIALKRLEVEKEQNEKIVKLLEHIVDILIDIRNGQLRI